MAAKGWKSDLPGVMSRPVEWYVLIREMEEFREATGYGLATVWRFVHWGNYEEARSLFDVNADIYFDTFPERRC